MRSIRNRKTSPPWERECIPRTEKLRSHQCRILPQYLHPTLQTIKLASSYCSLLLSHHPHPSILVTISTISYFDTSVRMVSVLSAAFTSRGLHIHTYAHRSISLHSLDLSLPSDQMSLTRRMESTAATRIRRLVSPRAREGARRPLPRRRSRGRARVHLLAEQLPSHGARVRRHERADALAAVVRSGKLRPALSLFLLLSLLSTEEEGAVFRAAAELALANLPVHTKQRTCRKCVAHATFPER